MASPSALEGRVAFVTGSTRGIGWETARALAGAGATVLVHGRDAHAAEARARELRDAFGATAASIAFDVGDVAATRKCYKRIFREHKRLDILVNNAGVLHDGLLGMIPADVIDETLRVNTAAVIHHIQEASRLMARGKPAGGAIVNLTSIMGITGKEGLVVYSASKAAVVGITRSAAKELAPKGIRVNAVAPGFIDTDMARAQTPEQHAARMRGIALGRIGAPAEVAHAVLFLASDASAYVTGQVLGVDGGMVV